MEQRYDPDVQPTQLRPLGVGELVDGGVSLWRLHLATLTTTTAVLVVPAVALDAAFRAWVLDRHGRGWHMAPGPSALLTLVGVAFALAASVHAAGQAFLGA